MAIYTKITKISESGNNHIYEICNDSDRVDCYAVLNNTRKTIEFYKDVLLKELLFEYAVLNDKDINKPFGVHGHLFARSLQKLIPAIKKGVFPLYLDKCS